MSTEIQITQTPITDIQPYPNNPRKNNKAIDVVAESIKEYGFQQPIVVDKNGVIIVGHTRYYASKKLKLSEVPVIVADNLTDVQIDAYRIADNKTNEYADWDEDVLIAELEQILKINQNQLTGFTEDELNKLFGVDDDSYSKKIETPVYEIKGEKPSEWELTNTDKTMELCAEIEASDIPQEVKQFLKIAAQRHTVFEYEKIAEYYAHATPQVQELMENSALVIIDFDKAIEQGFIELGNNIAKSYNKDYNET
jgi:hypothetical protein